MINVPVKRNKNQSVSNNFVAITNFANRVQHNTKHLTLIMPHSGTIPLKKTQQICKKKITNNKHFIDEATINHESFDRVFGFRKVIKFQQLLKQQLML